ncbi:MAG: PD-(D/E)XK nuclease family protein, partial [Candidatus Binatia bacterium]
HTEKRPERCPYCGSVHVAKKGTRKKKIEVVQLWRCASCKRVFTPAPSPLRNKTYPLKVVLDAITTYDLGFTLDKTTERIRSRYGHRIGRSTIAAWLAEHRALMTYGRLRAEGRRLYPPTQAIRSVKLYHRQIYKFEYHRPKLALLRQSREHRRFAPVADFLERVPIECPHELFRESERASQKGTSFLDTRHLIVTEKENAATRMAGLVIPSVGDNRLRHEALQRFMLANDSTTVAVEVPIWLTPSDIAALETEHGIELSPPGSSTGSITGHIDFLQVRNGAVHILDYKPGARADKPLAQLTIYALALTRLVPGLRLFDIKCAWFDEHEYCEFFPRTLLARRPANKAAV